MIEYMLHAVPQPAAVGTIAEFHLRMRNVRFSAGRAGVKCLFLARELTGLLGHAPLPGLHPPVDVLAEEEEEVADRSEHDQASAPGADQQFISIADPGKQRQPLDLYREDEQNVELEFRIEERKRQKHGAADEDVRHGIEGHEEGHGHGDDIPGQEEDIVPERAPMAFQGAPHEVEQVPREKNKDRARGRRNEQEGDEPPPLAHRDKIGDEDHAVDNEPARPLEHEKEHLPQDEIEGDVRYCVAA